MKKASQLGGFSVFLRMLSLYGKTPPNQGKVKKNAKRNKDWVMLGTIIRYEVFR
ncbi:hypothetical protein ACX3SV_10370 [Hafnia paralvei]